MRALLLVLVACTPLKPNAVPDPGTTCESPPCRCPSLPRETTEVHVALDAATGGNGTRECPLRTITEALLMIESRRDVAIRVGPGTYEVATGEVFPLVLRRGHSLIGAGPGETLIRGAGPRSGPQPGAPYESTIYVTVVAGDATSRTLIADLRLEGREGATAIICDRGNTAPFGAEPTAPNTIVERVDFRPTYHAAIIAGFDGEAPPGCNLAVRSSSFEGMHTGIWATWSGEPIKVPQAITVEESTFSNLSFGVNVWDQTAFTAVRNSSFTDCEHGVAVTAHEDDGAIGSTYRFAFENNRFERNSGRALYVGGVSVVRELSGNEIRASGVALLLSGTQDPPFLPRILHARRNVLVGNEAGVQVTGVTPISPESAPFFDFGRPEDPGENEIRCNRDFDVSIEIQTATTVSFQLSGNLWDHAPPDGNDLLTSGASLRIDTSRAAAASGPCPR